eukprot:746111-Hanusia_phi.AAC.2
MHLPHSELTSDSRSPPPPQHHHYQPPPHHHHHHLLLLIHLPAAPHSPPPPPHSPARSSSDLDRESAADKSLGDQELMPMSKEVSPNSFHLVLSFSQKEEDESGRARIVLGIYLTCLPSSSPSLPLPVSLPPPPHPSPSHSVPLDRSVDTLHEPLNPGAHGP